MKIRCVWVTILLFLGKLYWVKAKSVNSSITRNAVKFIIEKINFFDRCEGNSDFEFSVEVSFLANFQKQRLILKYDVRKSHMKSYFFRYQFYEKFSELKFFSIKFPIEWAIGELSRIILKFCKKWHFNGKFKIKIAFAPIEKIDFFRIFFSQDFFELIG